MPAPSQYCPPMTQLEISVDLGFGFEMQTVTVRTGKISMRDPMGFRGHHAARVPMLYVEGECGSRYWVELSRLYRRTDDGCLTPRGYLAREFDRAKTAKPDAFFLYADGRESGPYSDLEKAKADACNATVRGAQYVGVFRASDWREVWAP